MRGGSDTIAAICTPPGTGGVALVRLSGQAALEIALRHLDTDTLKPRHATYCHFDELDDVVATYMPSGYTGEPTVEMTCHGSAYVQQALLQTLLDDGARLAEPGEFTMRAFLGGRMNLSQAEAVADLIEATTPAQHRLAVGQLRGGYADQLREMRQRLLELTSLMELELDFSQEDVEFADRTKLLALTEALMAKACTLIDSFKQGNALKHGIPVAIVGKPNVGKSTLLNALLHDDRAIVSPHPGTTRDTVEASLTLDGITFRLIDTAGLRDTADEVERMGIERSHKATEEAEIVVEVEDVSTGYKNADITQHKDGKKHLRVLNKCDLDNTAYQLDGQWAGDTLYVCTSARDGVGMGRLEKALLDATKGYRHTDTLLANGRHRDALRQMCEALGNVRNGLESGMPTDLVAVDLRDALYHLGTITGDTTTDELLSSIFSNFCVGK